MSLHVQTFALGPLETNSYVLTRQGQCWLIDVGMWAKPLVQFLQQADLVPQTILLTHGHGDHIGGVPYLREHYPQATLQCPRNDEAMLTSPEQNLSATFLMGIEAGPADQLIEPGQSLRLGEAEWQILDTSGHTPGGVSFYCPAEKVVFTGDSLFAGSIGRTDIPKGNGEQLIDNIRRNLLTLPGDTTVYPGHGGPTTIEAETARNPFLQSPR
jgi:glyoxylase-like metal-dependent hydrolase (beta-lactamase superfamily II)